MPEVRLTLRILSVGTMVLSAGVVFGQNYPNKPIRIVAGEPGGATDLLTRVVAQGISGPLGQPVIVYNRVGAVISGETVAKAPPDGYTLLLNANNFWIGTLFQKAPYDPVKDFSPVTLVGMAPLILVMHPSWPVKSVKDLIALAKAKPGELNYAMSAAGGSPHLSAELFKAMAGVNIVGVSYKSSGPGMSSLIGGEVQLMFSSAAAVTPHFKSGKLNALAVTSAHPSALFPGLPTVAETLSGYESASTYGIFVPAKTPARIVDRLNQEILAALRRPDVKEKFLTLGVETLGTTPGRLADTIRSDVTKFGKVINDAGIRAN